MNKFNLTVTCPDSTRIKYILLTVYDVFYILKHMEKCHGRGNFTSMISIYREGL